MRVGPQRRSVLRAFRRRPLLLPKTQPPAFAHLLDLNAPRLALRFDLTTLNLVLASAETLGITRGAEREHLALAAASKRLSDLETRLGVALFERRARDVLPAEAGRALVRHIRALNASLHALESEVVEFSRGIQGHLRIAAHASAIAECLPADLAAFSQAHPGIRINLEDLTSAELQAAVADGHADVGILVPPQVGNRLFAAPTAAVSWRCWCRRALAQAVGKLLLQQVLDLLGRQGHRQQAAAEGLHAEGIGIALLVRVHGQLADEARPAPAGDGSGEAA